MQKLLFLLTILPSVFNLLDTEKLWEELNYDNYVIKRNYEKKLEEDLLFGWDNSERIENIKNKVVNNI